MKLIMKLGFKKMNNMLIFRKKYLSLKKSLPEKIVL